MSELTGKDEATLFSELRGVIFADYTMEIYDNSNKHCEISGCVYRTADDFLSGDVRKKLKEYTMALDTIDPDSPYYDSISYNVEALKLAQPKDLDASEISLRLGATWIEPQNLCSIS